MAAESLGLDPYTADDPASFAPRLAYYEPRVRVRSMELLGALDGEPGRPMTLDDWLETWRGR